MSTLWIREYSSLAVIGAESAAGRRSDDLAPAQIPVEPGVDQTAVTFSASAQSDPFGTETRYIAISADAAFHYVVGANPTATTNARRVTEGETLFIGVMPGQKIAAIEAA
jgi:hypothetical protein